MHFSLLAQIPLIFSVFVGVTDKTICHMKMILWTKNSFDKYGDN